MNYRLSEIYPLTALATSAGTLSIPLNLRDVISCLLFEYKVTRSTGAMIDHTVANLKNISLVDGSDVIFSMTGREMHALAHWDNGVPPYSFLSGISGVQSLLGIPYNFGTKLWDKSLAFDPKKYKNPMLLITFDPALTEAGLTTHYLSVQALCFDELAVSPSGYLMSKTYAQPAWVASGVYAADVLLPTDYPIRKLMMRGFLAASFVFQVINHFKITEDNDKKIPFDHDVSTFMKVINSMYRTYTEKMYLTNNSGGKAVYCAPSFDIAIPGSINSADKVPTTTNTALTVPITLTEATASESNLAISGHEPHHTIVVPFGDQMDMTDWYDTSKIGKLVLRMKGGSAGASSVVSVVTQQLRNY